MKILKLLIIAECYRIIEILEKVPDKDLKASSYWCIDDKAELKNKMHELRRDTVAFQNKLKI